MKLLSERMFYHMPLINCWMMVTMFVGSAGGKEKVVGWF
jgi:hypothetical protein